MVSNKKKRSQQKKLARTERTAPASSGGASAKPNKTDARRSDSYSSDEREKFFSELWKVMPKLQANIKKSNEDFNIFFPGKLKGAIARLFAKGCESYLEKVSTHCNDTPESLPVWIALSPQQRIKLTSEVMVGLLCEDEPLENIQTQQHFLAYLGVWKSIEVDINIELDSEYDMFGDDVQVERHSAIEESCPPELTNKSKRAETEEEKVDRRRKDAIKNKIASRQKRRLAKKAEKGLDIDASKIDESIKAGIRAKEEARKKTDTNNQFGGKDMMQYLIERNADVFEGGPPSQSSRSYLKPHPQDKEDEDMYHIYECRILCDDAFQDHEDPSIPNILPLKLLNFNWKLNDGASDSKWLRALYILFIEAGLVNYYAISNGVLDLHLGELTDETFANPDHHQRIMNIKRTIQLWRSAFDDSYDETQFYLNQRIIYAICAEQEWAATTHQGWLNHFLNICHEDNFSIDGVSGNYQKRLNAYRSLSSFDAPTTFYHSYFVSRPPPREYDDKNNIGGDLAGYYYESCRAHWCHSYSKKDLMKCSRCKVVKYCSTECQEKDWVNHKKDCKILAKMIKDKDKVYRICGEDL